MSGFNSQKTFRLATLNKLKQRLRMFTIAAIFVYHYDFITTHQLDIKLLISSVLPRNHTTTGAAAGRCPSPVMPIRPGVHLSGGHSYITLGIYTYYDYHGK